MTMTCSREMRGCGRSNAGTPIYLRLARKAVVDGLCLVWSGVVDGSGYGSVWLDRRRVKVHRIAWELANGPIPDGLWVLHHCDNRRCIKTEADDQFPQGHLFLGDRLANVRDMMSKGRGPNVKGQNNPNAKLTEEQVRNMRELGQQGWSISFLSSAFQVSQTTVWLVLNHRTWPVAD